MRNSEHAGSTKDHDNKETITGTNGVSKEGEESGPSNVSSPGMNQLVIHVKDEAKKSKCTLVISCLIIQ